MSYLNDLVWIGNILLPRWVPLTAMAICVLLFAAIAACIMIGIAR